jgi:hypothetical protein
MAHTGVAILMDDRATMRRYGDVSPAHRGSFHDQALPASIRLTNELFSLKSWDSSSGHGLWIPDKAVRFVLAIPRAAVGATPVRSEQRSLRELARPRLCARNSHDVAGVSLGRNDYV